MKKPVGILHVKVIRATKLLKMDLLGASDPYVKLSLSGERLPAKKTSIKMKNLNPEWNEDFKLLVKDPETQVLQLHVFDWEKVTNLKHSQMSKTFLCFYVLILNSAEDTRQAWDASNPFKVTCSTRNTKTHTRSKEEH